MTQETEQELETLENGGVPVKPEDENEESVTEDEDTDDEESTDDSGDASGGVSIPALA